MKLITIKELSVILRRSESTIRVDVTRRPHTLPPIVRIPGTRSILFNNVDEWLQQHTVVSEPPPPVRINQAKLIKRVPIKRGIGRRATPAIPANKPGR